GRLDGARVCRHQPADAGRRKFVGDQTPETADAGDQDRRGLKVPLSFLTGAGDRHLPVVSGTLFRGQRVVLGHQPVPPDTGGMTVISSPFCSGIGPGASLSFTAINTDGASRPSARRRCASRPPRSPASRATKSWEVQGASQSIATRAAPAASRAGPKNSTITRISLLRRHLAVFQPETQVGQSIGLN